MKVYVWYWVPLLLRAVEGLAGCPDDYRMHGGICYKAFDQTETFLDASEICSTAGGTLAMPRDNNTNAFLISLKNDVDSTGEFWFGLVDQHEEGAWEWIDGTPIGNYSAWSPGEPSNEDDEDCAEYSSNTWNEEECSEKRRFICQIILAGCPEGYIYHEPSRVCYKAFDDETENYAGAVAVCSSDGGTLAMPRDKATNNFLIYLKNAVDNKDQFRFGLANLHGEGTWMWANGVTLGNFSAWGPGEPKNHGQGEDCADYNAGDADNSENKWKNEPCSSNREFICQVIPTECPGGYRMHGGICYKAFDWERKFRDASRKCSTDCGTLAMPKDNNMNAFLISLINDVDVDSDHRFWFGLVDQHEEGAWEWIDGTPVGNYSAWSPGGPNNQGDEDCAEYSPTTTWNDERCSENRRFICQIILAGCPEGYIYHEPSRVCYKAFDDEKNYDDAVAACSSDGGTLAMPRDTATNNFLIYLKNAADNSAWFRFGLTELHREGTWMWVDNVTLGRFRAWGPDEPNNHDDQDEDCAEYFRGNDNNSKKNKWNDGPCSRDNRKFICQVIPTDYLTSTPSVGTERPSPSTGRVVEQSSSTLTIKPEVTPIIDDSTVYMYTVPTVRTERPSPSTDEEKKTPPWLVGVVCAAVVVLVIIAVVTVLQLLCRRKNNPCTNVPRKSGNEMKNLDTPERHGHAASEGTVDNIIYNTEDEGFVDNVIYNAGDDGTVDNIIYQGEDSKSNDQKNAPESQYESVN